MIAAGFDQATVDAAGLLLGIVIASGNEIFIDIAFEFIQALNHVELE